MRRIYGKFYVKMNGQPCWAQRSEAYSMPRWLAGLVAILAVSILGAAKATESTAGTA